LTVTLWVMLIILFVVPHPSPYWVQSFDLALINGIGWVA
jgi:hypothetical protein